MKAVNTALASEVNFDQKSMACRRWLSRTFSRGWGGESIVVVSPALFAF
jgi:hypothetical protein